MLDEPITHDHLLEKARALNFRRGLRVLAHAAWQHVRLSGASSWDMRPMERPRAHLVPYVAKLLLMHGPHGTRYWESPVLPEDVDYLLEGALHMADAPLIAQPQPSLPVFRAHAHRAMLYQSRFQRSWQQEVARAAYLYDELLPKVAPEVHSDIQTRFSDLLEADMGLFFSLVWIIFFHGVGREFSRGELVSALRPTNITEEDLDRALSALAIKRKDYADRARARTQRPEDMDTDFYEFNPLFQRPIVEVHPHRYIVPSPDCLLYRLTEGAYYSLYNTYFDIEHCPDNTFSNAFGHVFERYVCEQLGSLSPPLTVLDELSYDGRKFSDCTVIEEREAGLFECKTHRVPVGALVTGASPEMDDFVAKGIGKGLSQLKRCICDARNGRTGSAVDHLDRYYPVVVVMHPFPFVNVDDIRHIVPEDAVPSANGNIARYQVVSASELEHMVATRRDVSLCCLMREKTSEDLYRDGMHNFLCDVAKREGISELRHPVLAEAWERLIARLDRLVPLEKLAAADSGHTPRS